MHVLDVKDIPMTLDGRSKDILCMDIVGDAPQGEWNRPFKLQKKLTDKPGYMSMPLILCNSSAMMNSDIAL